MTINTSQLVLGKARRLVLTSVLNNIIRPVYELILTTSVYIIRTDTGALKRGTRGRDNQPPREDGGSKMGRPSQKPPAKRSADGGPECSIRACFYVSTSVDRSIRTEYMCA